MRLGGVLRRLAVVEREARRRPVEPGPSWFESALTLASVSELRELRDAIEAGTFTLGHPTVAALRGRYERGEERPPEERRPSPASAGRAKRSEPGPGADRSGAPEPVVQVRPEGPVCVERAGPPEAAAEAWKPSPEFAPVAFVWRAEGSRDEETLARRLGVDAETIF